MATADGIGFKAVLILIFPQGAGCVADSKDHEMVAGSSGSKDHEMEWAELLVVAAAAANSSRN